MHGSLCPSHLGAAGFVKSFVHDSLLSMGSCTRSTSPPARVPLVEGDASVDLEPSPRELLGVERGEVSPEGVVAVFPRTEQVIEFPSSISAAGRRVWLETPFSGRKDVAFCTGTLPAASVIGIALDLKKPFKLCWPLVAAGGVFVTDSDFARLSGLFGDVLAIDRFRIAGGNELVGMVVLSETWVGLSPTAVIDWSGIASGSFSVDGTSSSRSVLDTTVLCDVGREGLRANISPISLRRSNSGISFPDNGSKSFLECSRWRLPWRNIPGGFMTSCTSTCLPSIDILSFRVAKTGQ